MTFSYGGSDTLATQIKNGAPADVFASANLAQMKVVNDAYFVNTPKTFAKNRLVMVTPKAATLKLTSPGRPREARRKNHSRGANRARRRLRAPDVRETERQ